MATSRVRRNRGLFGDVPSFHRVCASLGVLKNKKAPWVHVEASFVLSLVDLLVHLMETRKTADKSVPDLTWNIHEDRKEG